MGSIETTYDLSKDLTIAKATGRMTANDFHEWRANYYSGTITSLILWDLTKAEVSDIKTEDLIDGARRTKNRAHVRRGGKTAAVTSDPLVYGLSRMFEAHSEFEDMPFAVQVFRSVDKAREWLGI